ncbi:MAG: HlyD family efflux transporter periplasmic adaptor subunit [Deltaproteobacteria bacterium]|nr:HlyD family efflux transporter periplasmic adaptor subunit [Deltaproteobacteria bacterium]MBW2393516.1 HlyD family efflux transporter periplasmic adaptor subunit [Deltaproteobacteria bacterium]
MKPILQAWLSRQCESGGRSARGTLWVRKAPEAPLELVAIHPPGLGLGLPDPEGHRPAAAAALAATRAVVKGGEEKDLLAAPGVYGGLHVAAVVEHPCATPREQAATLDVLRIGLGWLGWASSLEGPRDKASKGRSARSPNVARTLDLLAVALESRPVSATSLVIATELAHQLGCERVSLGRFQGNELVLDAVSNTAQLDVRSRLAGDIVAAMQEAIDQDAVIVYPAPEDGAQLAVAAHRRLADEQALARVWTLPLRDDETLAGALLVEFIPGQRPPKGTLAWLEQLVSLLAPVLGLRHRDQASFGERVRLLLREDLPDALGLERLNVRLTLGLGVFLLLALALLPATHRIAAPAQLEGIVQRAIVSPMQAYVAESRYRAGDVVKKGEVLGVLEDADLRLEARKWEAKREQRRKELRAAMAERDRSQVRILQAQVEQADAELALIIEQRRRTRLVAPFDGVITRGDLSQSLGSPVERGEVLFEVAPQDDYRITLEVDGQDIGFVEPGQVGGLTLQALPGEARPFIVRRVTPISSAEEGRSFFRVEAALEGDGSGLRPGMDGVAKIDVGRRSLLWIWTHSALDWLRMAWWAWVP